MVVSNMIEQTSIKHDRLLKKITEPLQQHLGISYFCYQFVSNEGQWFTLGSQPSWLLHSAESKFYECDPSLANPKHYRSGVCFPEYHANEDFQRSWHFLGDGSHFVSFCAHCKLDRLLAFELV